MHRNLAVAAACLSTCMTGLHASAARVSLLEAELLRTETPVPFDLLPADDPRRDLLPNQQVFSLPGGLELTLFRAQITGPFSFLASQPGPGAIRSGPVVEIRSTTGEPFTFGGLTFGPASGDGSALGLTGELDESIIFNEFIVGNSRSDPVREPEALTFDEPESLTRLELTPVGDFGGGSIPVDGLQIFEPTLPGTGSGTGTAIPSPAAAASGLFLLVGLASRRPVCREAAGRRRAA